MQNDEVPKPPIPKGRLEDLGNMGEANLSLANFLELGPLYQEGMLLLPLFQNQVIKIVVLLLVL